MKTLILLSLCAVACTPTVTNTKPHPAKAEKKIAGQLTAVNATEHGIEAAKLLESKTGGLPLLVAGHGLMMVIQSPAIVVNVDGSLLIGRLDGSHLVIRAYVKPGQAAASVAPTSSTARRFETGPNGPTIHLEKQVESLSAVFPSIAVGESPPKTKDGTAWHAIGTAASALPVPAGTALFSVWKAGASTFTLRPTASLHEQLELNGPYENLPQADDFLFEGAVKDGAGFLASSSGRIAWYGVRYTHEGVAYRQRFYVLPTEKGGCMTIKAQARAAHSKELFQLADVAAAGFVPPTL